MLKNYFKVAMRNIVKHKFFSAINIFGLSLSMSICIILIMLIADQKNQDQYNSQKEQIYRINVTRLHSDSFVNEYVTTPLPLKEKLMTEYEGIESGVRIRRGFGNGWIKFDSDVNIPVAGFFTDPEFLSMFEYELASGDAATALSKPNSVVLKKETAEKIFGDVDPVGESIKVGEMGEFMVTGVLKEYKNRNTHIKFEALASISSLQQIEAQDSLLSASINNWKNTTAGWVYIQLKENTTPKTIESYLSQIDEEVYKDMDKIDYKFTLQQLNTVSPGPLKGNEIGPVLPMMFVYFLSGLAIVIMMSASFNYMNLSIARALTRAKEVGIRKVSGAMKHQIIFQFLMEAILISVFSLLLSQVLLIFLKAGFKQLNFAQLLQWDLSTDWDVQIYSMLLCLGIGLLSGLTPALLLSSFQPIQVLKDLSSTRLFSKIGLRKALIVTQFTFSLVFIISTVLIYNQLKLMISADFGFNYNEVVNVKIGDTSYEQLSNEYKKDAAIEIVAASSHVPAAGNTYSNDMKRNVSDEGDGIETAYYHVDEGYIPLLDIQLVAGANFEDTKPKPNEIIVNEKTVETFGFGKPSTAIGQFIFSSDSTAYKIIGVVADYNHQALMQEIIPMYLVNDPAGFNIIHVKLNANNKDSGISAIEAGWAAINPNLQVNHVYFESELKEFYQFMFGDLIKIVSLISVLALIISSLGLLGMATYTTETRIKEVSVRKVLGASNWQLIFNLSKGFIVLMLVAIILAVPMAWFLNNLWLEMIAYRVSINAGVLLLGITVLLLIGGLAIGSQTYRATSVNPADNLRNE